MRELTYGEKVVGFTLHPSYSEHHRHLKELFAQILDYHDYGRSHETDPRLARLHADALGQVIAAAEASLLVSAASHARKS